MHATFFKINGLRDTLHVLCLPKEVFKYIKIYEFVFTIMANFLHNIDLIRLQH